MDLIVLPGNSSLHKSWTPIIEDLLKDLFDNTYNIDYSHWQTGEPVLDIKTETEKLIKLANEITSNAKSYAIFAKSAGTLLTLKSIYNKSINPQKCIFLGTPINWGYQNGFKYMPWLETFKTPTLFIQQEADPYGSFAELKSLINIHTKSGEDTITKPFKFAKIDGNNHHYDDYPLLKSLIAQFI